MGLFGSGKKRFEDIQEPSNLNVVVKEDHNGYITAIANGLVYGKIKPGGDMILNEKILGKTNLVSEALLVFTAIINGTREGTEIARLITDFRKHQKNSK